MVVKTHEPRNIPLPKLHDLVIVKLRISLSVIMYSQRMFMCWLVLYLLLIAGCKDSALQPGKDWPVYGGNKNGNRYSPLQQITIQNVKNLQVAWMYNAAEEPDRDNPGQRPKAIQCQPIVVRGILYGTTSDAKLFAVDGATGKQLWKFSPEKDNKKYYLNSNRGLVYWEAGGDKRILYSTGSTLYAVNASTGQPVSSFGTNGNP